MNEQQKLQALNKLFHDLFRGRPAHCWRHLELQFGQRIASELPGRNAAAAELFFEASQELLRKRLVTQSWLEALRGEFQGRQTDIDVVAKTFGLTLSPLSGDSAQGGTTAPTSPVNPAGTSPTVTAPAPSPIPEPTQSMTTPIRVLHLSDFHFSEKRQWDQDPVLLGLAAEVRKMSAAGLMPDLIAVTGDIADRGLASEYVLAKAWFKDQLLPAAGVGIDALWIVPGNHDVNRSAIKPMVKAYQETLRKSGSQDELKAALADPDERGSLLRRQAAFVGFLNDLGMGGRTDHTLPWWSERRTIRGMEVHLAGLNSAWLSTDDEDSSRLLLSRWQAYELLPKVPGDVDLSIALMHHPWSYFAEWDQHTVEEEVRRRAGVLLRGHLHDQKTRQASDPDREFLELAAGAAYSGGQWANAFQLLELDPLAGGARIHFRYWDGFEWQVDLNRYRSAGDGVAHMPLRRSPRLKQPTPKPTPEGD